jgi:AcrR family transcriptional regulator
MQTQRAIEQAFIELLREKGYDAITVGDIIQRADVGRSTFYRYYENKAALLLGFHVQIFDGLRIGLATQEDWLGDAPSPRLMEFFEKLQRHARVQPFLYSLGNDLEFLIQRIDELMAQQFDDLLRQAFEGEQLSMPVPTLAHSVAGVYSWVFRWWVSKHPPYTAAEVAGYVHRLTRAMLREALRD